MRGLACLSGPPRARRRPLLGPRGRTQTRWRPPPRVARVRCCPSKRSFRRGPLAKRVAGAKGAKDDAPVREGRGFERCAGRGRQNGIELDCSFDVRSWRGKEGTRAAFQAYSSAARAGLHMALRTSGRGGPNQTLYGGNVGPDQGPAGAPPARPPPSRGIGCDDTPRGGKRPTRVRPPDGVAPALHPVGHGRRACSIRQGTALPGQQQWGVRRGCGPAAAATATPLPPLRRAPCADRQAGGGRFVDCGSSRRTGLPAQPSRLRCPRQPSTGGIWRRNPKAGTGRSLLCAASFSNVIEAGRATSAIVPSAVLPRPRRRASRRAAAQLRRCVALPGPLNRPSPAAPPRVIVLERV